MTVPAVLHPPAEAVEDSLLVPHQLEVEAGPGAVVGHFPHPEAGGGGRSGEFLYGECFVLPSEVDAAPGISPAAPGELPPLRLALSAGHEGVDHHLVPSHHPAVVTPSLGEVGPHISLLSLCSG